VGERLLQKLGLLQGGEKQAVGFGEGKVCDGLGPKGVMLSWEGG